MKTVSVDEVVLLHNRPLFLLLDEARRVHLEHHPESEVQLCTLLSVKTGGCPEDCSYCPQSSHYESPVEAEKMLDVDAVLANAKRAKELGATRFCMGAAWREVKDGPAFDRELSMYKGE
jgi:biotin synthase